MREEERMWVCVNVCLRGKKVRLCASVCHTFVIFMPREATVFLFFNYEGNMKDGFYDFTGKKHRYIERAKER